MKPTIYAATFIGMFYGAIAGGTTTAEAARCKQGMIWRPSVGVCVSKASAMRAGVYRARHAKASIRHRYKRPPVARASNVQKPQIAAPDSMQETNRTFPPPTPPWIERTPVVEGFEADVIAPSPFGRLLPMPETVTAWAIRNGVDQ